MPYAAKDLISLVDRNKFYARKGEEVRVLTVNGEQCVIEKDGQKWWGFVRDVTDVKPATTIDVVEKAPEEPKHREPSAKKVNNNPNQSSLF